MIKRILIILFFSGLWMDSAAQKIGSDIINSGGQTFTSSNYILSYSIGEPINSTLVSSDKLLTQGFIQHSFETILSVDNDAVESTISIYPNPVESKLYLSGVEDISLNIRIIDTLGRVVYNNETSEKAIELEGIPSGVYYAYIIKNKSKTHQVFKIVKK